MDAVIEVTCRRCIEKTEFELDQMLSVRIPDCPGCGRPMVRLTTESGIVSGADFALAPDRSSMRAIQRVPGLVPMVKAFGRVVQDDDLLLDHLADNIRVSSDQLPEVWNAYREAGERLDINEELLPPLFVDGDRSIQAYAQGINYGLIVVTVGALELLNEGELIAVLGHELGHVMAGHVPYSTAIQFARVGLGRIAGWTPVAWDDLVMMAANPAYLAWLRSAERTADRAGMLAARQPRDMLTALMKIAGAPPRSVSELNLAAFKEQASLFEELRTSSVKRRVLVAEDVLRRSHPFPAVRVSELVDLVGSGQWFDVLEQVFDPEPSRWERPCEQCGGHVAEWDLHCRHCGEPVLDGGGTPDVSASDDPDVAASDDADGPTLSGRAADLLRRVGGRSSEDG